MTASRPPLGSTALAGIDESPAVRFDPVECRSEAELTAELRHRIRTGAGVLPAENGLRLAIQAHARRLSRLTCPRQRRAVMEMVCDLRDRLDRHRQARQALFATR